MKNQYFGDINDYRKYGLLRLLQAGHDGRLLVAWMLTPDDGGPDGGFRTYLREPQKWRHHDPELYDGLSELVGTVDEPRVGLLEESRLLPRARFHSSIVPDGRRDRDAWSRALIDAAAGADLVFLDPDNGIEVPSKPIGRKDSSKYVSWKEIEGLAGTGSSLLIYQHFPREPRDIFIGRITSELQRRTKAAVTRAIRTPHVLFLLVVQQRHLSLYGNSFLQGGPRWNGQLWEQGPG